MKAITQLALSLAVTSLENATKRATEDTQEMIGRDNLIDLITHYAELREVNETIKKARKLIEDLEDHMSHEDVPDAFRRSSIKTVSIEGVGRVTVAHKWGCSVNDGKKPESFQWLRDGGNGGIIIEKNTALDANGTTKIGYGFAGSPNTNNRAIQQATFDWISTFWQNPRHGALQAYTQYSYLTRAPWYVVPGTPRNAHLSMVYVGLRYVLPTTSGTLAKVPRPD